MIRKQLHRRWADGGLWREIQRTDHDTWIDRFIDWHVATYGERPSREPWPMHSVTLFVCWLQDWRHTWRMRP